jgi:hypothetical protein
MNKIDFENLNLRARRILQFGVIIVLAIFLGLYLYLSNKPNDLIAEEKTIYLENSKLHVFNDVYSFDGYPDKLLFHYPYFILIKGNQSKSIIYNIETKNKEKELDEIVLDYLDGNIIYNKKETFYNDKGLGKICESAFIKSDIEILCITKQNKDAIDNMLVSIDPNNPTLWKLVYKSENILTTVAIINDNLYIGELNYKDKRSFITTPNNTVAVDAPVTLIYKLNNEPYYVSLKGELNPLGESHYLIGKDSIIMQQTPIYFSE